ncbi:type I-E CRISPR-associated protein Cas5/CasD [Lactobacillus sp. ESL0684]|uniref:type I-E CRISPR-associated protein Cas5/CasD n=1 Tax=Lactobacillus sp. ESL0684 TaxID=2983213 RepID=UPI0023F8A234|nr:type I-E CRISPR-associated protein Cas5/CasD [Lactobacillus sp. ESL0684]WEV43554.1 type I-E CRISPR-associated protein Cas5/CasD [Lactobacillus sp. ESL0684]
MKTLTIRLTAPLQSYGNEATFERRTTGDYPSKSAVIGMIAAAFGLSREDPQVIQLNNLAFAVRIDQRGSILSDFQTVEWKKGKPRKLSYRNYLQDAVFIVAIGSDEETIDKIEFALKHPRYQLFLGRRANVPAGILKMQNFANEDPVSVLQKLDWQASEWYMKKNRREAQIRVELIADASLLPEVADNRCEMVKDQVISFSQENRQHGFRKVAIKQLKLLNPLFQADTEHDPISIL